jgi:alcohol dehydrogenase
MTLYKALESIKAESGNTLHIVEKDTKDLPEGDLLVKVEYSSLNFKDAMSASGMPGVTRNYPHTPGIDASGLVVESNDQSFKEGDSVIVTGYDLGMNTSGGFGEYIRIPSSWAIALPGSLSSRDSMILGTAGLTAGLSVAALESYRGLSDVKAVVSGSTGGVGSIAVKLLAHSGAEITAISGKQDQKEFLTSLGANQILSREELQETVRRPLGKGVWDIGVDVVSGEVLSTLLAGMNPGGAIACSGLVGGAKFDASILPFILRGVSLLGIDSVEIPLSKKQEIWDRLASDWSVSLEAITKEVQLETLEDEIKLILAGGQVGRVLVKL